MKEEKTVSLIVRYEKDNSKVGVSSDYGKQLIVCKANNEHYIKKQYDFFLFFII
jgi:hypothetical protein